MGDVIRDAVAQVYNLTTQNDYYARFHCEQTTLHGDPALKMAISGDQPDYVIEDPMVEINPSFISVAEKFIHDQSKIHEPEQGREYSDRD